MTTQPEFGKQIERVRSTANNGKKMSRAGFSKMVGMSPAQLRNIEFGRQVNANEVKKITDAFPELLIDQNGNDVPEQLSIDNTRDNQLDNEVNSPPKLPGVKAEVIGENHDFMDLYAYDLEDEEDIEDLIERPAATAVIQPVEDPLTPGDRTQLSIYTSNSEVQTFKRCRRKWYLAWYRGLRFKVKDAVGPLATGSRVHNALKAWYVPDGEQPEDPRVALEHVIQRDWEAAHEAFTLNNVQPPQDFASSFKSANDLERAMVEGYMQWLAETGADRGLRVVASETYLEVPFDVPGSVQDVMVVGKLDVRVVREIDGVRLFVDHKTTASLTEPLKTIRLDEQMLHYHLLEWLSAIEGERCDGALYNMLKKVKRTGKAVPPFFDRVEVRHNQHELESFKNRLTGVLRDIIAVRKQLDQGEDHRLVAYPTPNKNCSWDCDFLAVCTMFDDGSRAEDMVSQHYEANDPFTYYRE